MRPFLHVGNHFVTHFQREEYLVLEQKLLKRTVCTCSSRSCSFLCLRASSCSFTSEPASVISAWLHPGARQRRLYVYMYHVHAHVRALQLVQPPFRGALETLDCTAQYDHRGLCYAGLELNGFRAFALQLY